MPRKIFLCVGLLLGVFSPLLLAPGSLGRLPGLGRRAAARASTAGSRLITVKRWDKILNPAVGYTHISARSGGGPVRIHILTYNLFSGAYRAQPALAGNRVYYLKTLSEIVSHAGALAGINGTYFLRRKPFLPIGLIMINGQVAFLTELKRSALGISDYGEVVVGTPEAKGLVITNTGLDYFYIHGMNRPRKKNEVIVYTPYYGERTKTNPFGLELVVKGNRVQQVVAGGNSLIPYDGYVISLHGPQASLARTLKRGEPIRFVFSIRREWENVTQVITGGPTLLKKGMVNITSYQEGFHYSPYTRNPLTAVGRTIDNKLLMVVVDGRRKGYSVGASYAELAQYLQTFGTTDAVCMDGGGSSTMVIGGVVVNRPSDGAQRKISNALVLKRVPDVPLN